jgi:hypothetical protein
MNGDTGVKEEASIYEIGSQHAVRDINQAGGHIYQAGRDLIIYKWSFSLVLIAAITDYLVMTSYFSSIISIETLVTLNSVLIAAAGIMYQVKATAVGIMYQVKATNEREMQFKVHQQRKETYEELIGLMEKMFKLIKANSNDFSSLEDDYRRFRPKMIIYASPQVVAAYTAIQNAGSHDQKKDSMLAVRRLVNLYSLIRSEVGFMDKDVPTRQLLSLILTDINDPKYDVIFDKNGYLLPDDTR